MLTDTILIPIIVLITLVVWTGIILAVRFALSALTAGADSPARQPVTIGGRHYYIVPDQVYTDLLYHEYLGEKLGRKDIQKTKGN